MSQTVTRTFPAGSYTWIAPLDVTSVTVELWGGGGAGGGTITNGGGGGGGAGGQYAVKVVAVTGGTSHAIVAAATKAGGIGNGGAGNDSTFDSTTAVAKGGAGGLVGSGAGGVGATTNGVGDTVFAGGSGSAGAASTRSGGGGGGAGSTGAGGSTTASTTGGTGTSVGGGNGGAGLAAGANANGGAGSDLGGGGGGAYRTATTSRSGGTGAAGQVKITYTTNDVDVVNQTSQVAAATNVNTISHTHPSGYVHTGLLVGINTYTSAGQAQAQVTGVTFGGVALTRLIAQVANAGQNNYMEWWYLDNPTASTANVVVTFTGGAGDDESAVTVLSLINTAASQADASAGHLDPSSTTASVSVTTVADRAVTFSNTQNQTGATGPTPTGTGQIAIYNPNANNAFAQIAAKTPAGAVTHSWSGGAAGDNFVSAAVSIKPYVAPASTNSNFFALMR